jgi:hypothetical protein
MRKVSRKNGEEAMQKLRRKYYTRRSEWEMHMAPLRASLRILQDMGLMEPEAVEDVIQPLEQNFEEQTKRFRHILNTGVVLKVYGSEKVWKTVEVPRTVTMDQLACFLFRLWGIDDSVPYGMYCIESDRRDLFEIVYGRDDTITSCFGHMKLQDGLYADSRDLTLWNWCLDKDFRLALYGKYKDGCCLTAEYVESTEEAEDLRLLAESPETLDFKEKGNQDQWMDILPLDYYMPGETNLRRWRNRFRELDHMTDKIQGNHVPEKYAQFEYLMRAEKEEEDE